MRNPEKFGRYRRKRRSSGESGVLSEDVGWARSEHQEHIDDSTLGEPVSVDLWDLISLHEVHQLGKHVLHRHKHSTPAGKVS